MDKDVDEVTAQVTTGHAVAVALPKEKKRTSGKKPKAAAQVIPDAVEVEIEIEQLTNPLPIEELELAYAVEAVVSAELDFDQLLLDFLQARIAQFKQAGQELSAKVNSSSVTQLYVALEDLSFSLQVLAKSGIEVAGSSKLAKKLAKLRKELISLSKRENFLENLAKFGESQSQPSVQLLAQLQAKVQRQRDKVSKRLGKALDKLASSHTLVSQEQNTIYASTN